MTDNSTPPEASAAPKSLLTQFLKTPDPGRLHPLLGALALAIVVAATIFSASRPSYLPRGPVLGLFQFLWENLPLTLPVLSACLSVMLNYRDLLKPYGWLRLPLPFALGLVSFSVWYVVAAQTTQGDYIPIGPAKVLFKHYSLILVITAFIWAGFCAMNRVIADAAEKDARGWLWHSRQVALLSVSAFALFVPFFLFEQKVDVEQRTHQSLDQKPFTVSVAWKDPSLYAILGKQSDDIVFCQVQRQVFAKTPGEAVSEARRQFMQSPDSHQRFGKAAPDALVKFQDSLVVAEINDGPRR